MIAGREVADVIAIQFVKESNGVLITVMTRGLLFPTANNVKAERVVSREDIRIDRFKCYLERLKWKVDECDGVFRVDFPYAFIHTRESFLSKPSIVVMTMPLRYRGHISCFTVMMRFHFLLDRIVLS